ncbi:B12-binding domain-containing radical SAM protein [Faecalibacter bovis]|uniref:B12-binding domain-containing radical SAM protein n=1 Tax=Faecalibacter bovis TaxID=2898187 RepID=A0ABX7XCG4_9FLAO|nr:radical SAM protein [Faecalibacter bovis]QTV05592.1 B12-binding domain-containing radical SAM protein [Faecalibacter bovis]
MQPSILLTTLNAKYIHINLAIRILYDLNHKRGNIDWKEFTIKLDFDEIATKCAKYDIVCFSCYIWNISQTLEVCKRIKSISPNTKILLGGPEVSYEYDDVIAQDCVDYIIVGEGEIPFEKFVEHYPTVENVPNLVYKKEGKIIFNKENVTFDIQNLKGRNPYQYDDPSTLINRVCYIETSRGCPYKCEFCLASLDNKMRYLPMDTIKQNLLYLMEHGKTIKFLDRTFNIKRDFTIELFQFILDHHKPGNVFQFEITADIVHPDIIKFINEKVPPGLFRFEIGIQTVNQESNREVSRKQNFEKTSNVIHQLKERIEMHLDLIVGLPLEYISDLKFSFESTFKLYPPELQLGFLKFLKGTPVREKYENYGYKFDPEPPYQIIESNFLSAQELQDITDLENALEIYWNKPRAFNTLKYVSENYSIFDYLMGLGKYFGERNHAYKFTIIEIYETILEYTKANFNDELLLQLIAIDYYTNQKSKPKDLFEFELNKKATEIFKEANEIETKDRLVLLPISFDWKVWNSDLKIIESNEMFALYYPGNTLPKIESIQNYKVEIPT